MTTKIIQTDKYGPVNVETSVVDISTNDKSVESVLNHDVSPMETTEAWESTQVKITAFLKNTISSIKELFQNNKQALATLGIIYVALLGIKLLFAALGAIDDIPLVSPILKLIGLVYVINFAWRHLIREHDRQELIKMIDRTKAEIFGNQSSNNP
jgi:CAAD domains of cyanobacterial aminoacyl-tRNA synthetase